MTNIILEFYNPGLKIAFGKWDQVYLIEEVNEPIKLNPEYYKGYLVYRLPGSISEFLINV